jgi:hypothetical protein
MKNFTETDYFKDIEQKTINCELQGYHRYFRIIFEKLESLNKDKYNIVETGCVRWDQNWSGEGQFTIIADAFVNYYDGNVYAVNNNEIDVKKAITYVSNKTIIELNCSLIFTKNFNKINDIDLFYLDSLDLNWNFPDESANHHLLEFNNIIENRNIPNFYLAIDDCNITTNNLVIGKGQCIIDYLNHLNIKPILNEYQVLYYIDEINFNIIKSNLNLIKMFFKNKIL